MKMKNDEWVYLVASIGQGCRWTGERGGLNQLIQQEILVKQHKLSLSGNWDRSSSRVIHRSRDLLTTIYALQGELPREEEMKRKGFPG